MDYFTSTDVGSSGLYTGKVLLAYFDNRDYINCLHGCMLLISLYVPSEIKYLYLEDGGLLHELMHLSLSTDIRTQDSLTTLRQHIKDLTNACRNRPKDSETQAH
jgi:hypothetical protein